MPETRSVSENHGDYEYTVQQGEAGVVSFRKPLNSPLDAPDEKVGYDDLPSESLKDAHLMYSWEQNSESAAIA
jgi:hypothetical protein